MKRRVKERSESALLSKGCCPIIMDASAVATACLERCPASPSRSSAATNGSRAATVGTSVKEEHLKIPLRHPSHLRSASRAAVGKGEAGNCHAGAALRLDENRVVVQTLGRRQPGGRRLGRGRCGGLLGLRLRGRLCRRCLWVAIASGAGRGVTWHPGPVFFSFAILESIDL